tara:strand:+ start:986 stop:1891 length:906 start_codon:yes stop_codon:yes gene_type:complete
MFSLFSLVISLAYPDSGLPNVPHAFVHSDIGKLNLHTSLFQALFITVIIQSCIFTICELSLTDLSVTDIFGCNHALGSSFACIPAFTSGIHNASQSVSGIFLLYHSTNAFVTLGIESSGICFHRSHISLCCAGARLLPSIAAFFPSSSALSIASLSLAIGCGFDSSFLACNFPFAIRTFFCNSSFVGFFCSPHAGGGVGGSSSSGLPFLTSSSAFFSTIPFGGLFSIQSLLKSSDFTSIGSTHVSFLNSSIRVLALSWLYLLSVAFLFISSRRSLSVFLGTHTGSLASVGFVLAGIPHSGL